MEFEVNDQLFHCWSKVFPLKRHSDDLTVGVEDGARCRYRYQSVLGQVEQVEKLFVSSHMKNAIGLIEMIDARLGLQLHTGACQPPYAGAKSLG